MYADKPPEPTTIYAKGGVAWVELLFGLVVAGSFLAIFVYAVAFRPVGVRGTGNTIGFLLVGVPLCLFSIFLGLQSRAAGAPARPQQVATSTPPRPRRTRMRVWAHQLAGRAIDCTP
jgi:hypothetical protein